VPESIFDDIKGYGDPLSQMTDYSLPKGHFGSYPPDPQSPSSGGNILEVEKRPSFLYLWFLERLELEYPEAPGFYPERCT
jgi:hypothetical protein